MIAGSLILVGIIAYMSRNLPNPDSLTERTISQTTKIYDKSGENLLYEIFGDENRTLKQLKEGFCHDDKKMSFDETGVPIFAVQATIAAEDRKFCSHGGFDVRGILRAVFQNLRGKRVGGSTLTQQLVKNAILSNEKTISRKIKELMLSIELERRYSKDEILQIYFNEIPYGSTFYGIEAASQNYFNKTANDLTLSEAATLASLPKAPTTYLNNPDRLHARRNYILNEMNELGFITNEEAEQAIKEETPTEIQVINIKAPHFVMYVKEQLEELYGRRTVEEGGLKVITTLDFEIQEIAEEEVKKGVEEIGEIKGFNNASLVAINPKNGHILSMVGSKDFFDDEIDGQVNIATRLRQPGSSFKPIVYTKAFELGYTPNTVLWDVVTEFASATGPYIPNNYDLEERGPVRVRNALQGSLNIPAVKMIYLVGIENALDFAKKLGYTSFNDYSNFGLSLVLGGGEVKLLEHVNAYAVLANDGIRNDHVSILKVEDSNGVVLDEWKERDGKIVIDENITRTINHVLSDNDARTPFFGASSTLNIPGYKVAAKTGTTNDYRDGWLMGYTPSISIGVWAGNNDNTKMKKGSGGSSAAGPIWNSFTKKVLQKIPSENFPSPIIESTGKQILDGEIASQKIIIDKMSGKIATEFTPESQKEEVLFAEYHSALHYINKSDPTGSKPKNPENDSQYEFWENAIQQWIKKKEEETGIKITQNAPPTETDDVHTTKNIPIVHFLTPIEGQDFERELSVEINAQAPRGISRIELYIDGQYLDSDSNYPYKFVNTLPAQIKKGFHTIKAIAYDDVENAGSDTISININQNSKDAVIEIIDPTNKQKIERIIDEYTVVLQLKDPNNYLAVTIYANPIGAGKKQTVGQIINPSTPFVTIPWLLPKNGSWALSAKARPKDGSKDIFSTGSIVYIKSVETNESNKEDSESIETEETNNDLEEEIFIPIEEITLF